MKNKQRKIKDKSNAGLKGIYTLTKFKAGTREVLSQQTVENLIVANANHGVDLITQHLVGITTYPLDITKASIGSGTATPTTADTDLETPVVEDIVRTNGVATPTSVTLDFFIPDALLPDGTYGEFGLFCGDQLFARSLIDPAFTKASGEDTSINYQIIISTS